MTLKPLSDNVLLKGVEEEKTAGGLILSVPEARGKELLARLHDAGVPAAAIGRVLPRGARMVSVKK